MSGTKVTAKGNDLISTLRKAVAEFLADDDVSVNVDLSEDLDITDVKVKLSGKVTLRGDGEGPDGAAAVNQDQDEADDGDLDGVGSAGDGDGGDGDGSAVAADAEATDEASDDEGDDSQDDGDDSQDDDDGGDGGDGGDDDDQLDREVDVAADFVEGILDALELAGRLELRLNDAEQSAEVEIVDMDSGVLIGRRGSTLDSIQELMRCALQSQFDRRVRITVDVEGYRARRIEKMLDKADEAIDEVLDTGEGVRLEPMDVFERKAVHELVGTVDGVSSRSQGRDPSRRVVIELNES